MEADQKGSAAGSRASAPAACSYFYLITGANHHFQK
jgi:hypothetical protein